MVKFSTMDEKLLQKFPIIPLDLILEDIYPFLTTEEVNENVMEAVRTRRIGDLYLMVGRTKISVPASISGNEKYSIEAGCSVLLPVLNSLGFKISKCLFTTAAKKGNIDAMRWLRKEKDSSWDGNHTFTAAVEYGNLDICKWLKKNDCPWNVQAFHVASGTGDFALLEWLKEMECPWSVQSYLSPVIKGDLDTVKWLKRNGCPWDDHLFMAAAYYENLELMKWLFSNGCPWDKRTFQVATEKGNLKNLEWLKDNHCPGSEYFDIDESSMQSVFNLTFLFDF